LIRSGCFRTGDKTYLPRYKPRQIFMTVSITIVNNSKKWKNKREQYLKPEKSKQLTVLMRFSCISI
jgi:hypothetical protein